MCICVCAYISIHVYCRVNPEPDSAYLFTAFLFTASRFYSQAPASIVNGDYTSDSAYLFTLNLFTVSCFYSQAPASIVDGDYTSGSFFSFTAFPFTGGGRVVSGL